MDKKNILDRIGLAKETLEEHIELAYYTNGHGNGFGINSKDENPVLAWNKEDLEKLKEEDLEE